MTPPRHVVLVGMMASGKSTVGRLVADRLGRPLVDSDGLVERRTGRTVREIFETDGEPGFRQLEAAALADALSSPEPAVIAAGGGVVLAAENRASLTTGDTLVVWLRAVPGVLAARVAGGERPLLDADAEGALRQLSADREPLYAEVADVVVDAGRPLGEVADAVVEAAGRG
jgi:shikimate kinase